MWQRDSDVRNCGAPTREFALCARHLLASDTCSRPMSAAPTSTGLQSRLLRPPLRRMPLPGMARLRSTLTARLYLSWVYLKSFFLSLRMFASTRRHSDRFIYK